jgi:nitrogen regulatory protein P-II 1
MKLIRVAVKPFRLADVVAAAQAAGATGVTVSESKGLGRQGGHIDIYRGREYLIELVPKSRLDIVVDDEHADAVVEAVVDAARTGKIGDGKLWVEPVERVVRIRTGDLDGDAL